MTIAQIRPFGQRYAFVVVAVIFLSLLIAAGLRSSLSVMMLPLEDAFGWRRDVISLAAAVGIFIYGLAGPFALSGGVVSWRRNGAGVANGDRQVSRDG